MPHFLSVTDTLCSSTAVPGHGRRERLLSNLMATELPEDGEGSGVHREEEVVNLTETTRRLEYSQRVIGGGAGGGDAYTRRQDKIHLANTLQKTLQDIQAGHLRSIQATLPKMRPPTPEEVVDGLRIRRTRLADHAHVQHVLLQQPGKLRAQDLNAVMAAPQDGGQASEGGNTLGQSAYARAGILDDLSLNRQVKEAYFQKELGRVQQSEKAKDLKICLALGVELMTDDQLAAFKRAQAQQEAQRAADERAIGRERRTVELCEERAMHLTRVGDGATGGVALEVVSWEEIPTHVWGKRALVMRTFVLAVRRVIYRARMMGRLAAIQSAAAQSGAGSASVGAGSQRIDTTPAGGHGAAASSNDTLLRTFLERLADPSLTCTSINAGPRFPSFHPDAVRDLGPVDMSEYADVNTVEALPMTEPLAFCARGHSKEFPAPLVGHVPMATGTPDVLVGAQEEMAAGPVGIIDEARLLGECPELCRVSAACAPFPIKYGKETVTLPPTPAWGMDKDQLFRPVLYPFVDVTTTEVSGINACRALDMVSTLSHVWRPSLDDWQLEPFSPPELMLGPNPEDIMGSGSTQKPTQGLTPETVAGMFFVPPAGRFNMDAHAQSETKDEANVRQTDSTESSRQRLIRDSKQEELHRGLVKQRTEMIGRLSQRLVEFNGLVKDPRLRVAASHVVLP
eukprot:jgi/Mesvir1/13489/Mv16538-RA.3